MVEVGVSRETKSSRRVIMTDKRVMIGRCFALAPAAVTDIATVHACLASTAPRERYK